MLTGNKLQINNTESDPMHEDSHEYPSVDDIMLEVSNDGMRAFLMLPQTSDFLDEQIILDALAEANVREGFERAIEYAEQTGETREPGKPFLVALGQPVSEASIEFSPLFEEASMFNPAAFDNQYHLLNKYVSVREGEAVAHLFVTKPPKNGRDVHGEEMEAQMTTEEAIQARLGDNTRFDEDRSQVFATSNGYPYLDEHGRICVKSDFVIEGDIGLDWEHFTMFGNLTVRGGIREKLIIEVVGKLTVEGDIDDVTVKVDGDAVIKGDILNCRAGGVHVTGDVSFISADNALVVCAGRIRFTEHAQFCKLIAGKGVYGDPEGSSIVGGLVQSGEHIEAAVIGNAGAIGAEVEITISPYIKEKMLALTKKLAQLRDRPGDNEALIGQLSDQLSDFENQLEEDINQALLGDNAPPRHIIAYRKVFGGVYLRILKKSLTVVDEMEKVSFSVVDGELTADSFNTD